MLNSNKYHWCVVSECKSNSKATPEKLFICVPNKLDIRKRWLQLAKKDQYGFSDKSTIYFCEDHFDLPRDMANYMKYKIMGFVKKVQMKPGCMPSKFDCHLTQNRRGTISNSEFKKQRLSLGQEASSSNTHHYISTTTADDAFQHLTAYSHIQEESQKQRSFSKELNVQVVSKLGNKAGKDDSKNIKVKIDEEEYVPQMNYPISNTYSRKQQSTSLEFVHATTITENTNSQSNTSSTDIDDIKVEYEELIDYEDVKVEKDDLKYVGPQQIYCTSGNVSDALVLEKFKEEIHTECIDAQQDHYGSQNISEGFSLGEVKEEIKTEFIDARWGYYSSDNISDGFALGEIKDEIKTEFIDAQQGHCSSDNISKGLAIEKLVVEEIKEEIKTECADNYDISTNDF